MKLIDVAYYLVYVATYSIIVPIGIGIYLAKTLSKPLKILLAGLSIVFFLDILLLFFSLKAANTFFYFFTAVDVITMTWVFASGINHSLVRKVIISLGLLFILLIAIDAFFISGLTNNGISNAIERVLVFLMATYYLNKVFQEDIESNLFKHPLFWVCVGVIAFNLVGSFDMFSGPIMNYSQNLYLQYYMFGLTVNMFMYGCFSYAFWLSKYNSIR